MRSTKPTKRNVIVIINSLFVALTASSRVQILNAIFYTNRLDLKWHWLGFVASVA